MGETGEVMVACRGFRLAVAESERVTLAADVTEPEKHVRLKSVHPQLHLGPATATSFLLTEFTFDTRN